MNNKKICGTAAGLLCSLVLTGCASVWFTGPRGSADRSLPVTGSAYETGTISYIENKQGIFVKQSIEEQQQYPQSPTDIIIQGSIVKEKFNFATFFKEFLDSENSKGYEWTGTIRTTEFEAPAAISLIVTRKKATPDTQERDQPLKTYIMETGTAGDIEITLTEPYGDDFSGRAPYLAATFAVPDGRELSLYAAKEAAWGIHGRDADNQQIVDAQYPQTTTRKLYTLEDQLYQITDDTQTVIAEMQGNTYTLYDTIPDDLIQGAQSFMALFYGWQCIIEKQEKNESL